MNGSSPRKGISLSISMAHNLSVQVKLINTENANIHFLHSTTVPYQHQALLAIVKKKVSHQIYVDLILHSACSNVTAIYLLRLCDFCYY